METPILIDLITFKLKFILYKKDGSRNDTAWYQYIRGNQPMVPKVGEILSFDGLQSFQITTVAHNFVTHDVTRKELVSVDLQHVITVVGKEIQLPDEVHFD